MVGLSWGKEARKTLLFGDGRGEEMHLLTELDQTSQYPRGHDCPAWRTWDETQDDGHGITQIGLERSPCFGECPVYTAVIHASGRVEYEGIMNVPRLGARVGRANLHYFRQLAWFITGTRFWDMESHYDFRDAVVSDAPGTCVLVATANRRKIVSNYADAGPPELWAIAGLIDLVLGSVEWE